MISWLPGQDHIVYLIMYGLKPCFDLKSTSWCQSVDNSCNNNRDQPKLPVITELYGHIRANSIELEEEERDKEAGRSQGAALVVCPLIGRDRVGNEK